MRDYAGRQPPISKSPRRESYARSPIHQVTRGNRVGVAGATPSVVRGLQDVLQLQRRFGNRYVQQTIESAKGAGSASFQESASQSQVSVRSSQPATIQRTEAEETTASSDALRPASLQSVKYAANMRLRAAINNSPAI